MTYIMKIVGWYFILSLILNRPLAVSVRQKEFRDLEELAKFSAVSYCISQGKLQENRFLADTTCPLKFCSDRINRNVEIVSIFNPRAEDKTGTGYIALDHTPSKERIIVVFRGTASLKDWISDFNIKPVAYKPLTIPPKNEFKCEGCHVHEGFYTALKSYCSIVLSEVSKLKKLNPDYKVVVTGHSLGAALTILTGIEFKLKGFNPLVVSFAGPRVSDASMSRWIDKLFKTDEVLQEIGSEGSFSSGFIRVTHMGDYVPMVPPDPLYSHAGVEYYLSKRGLPQKIEHLLCMGSYETGIPETEIHRSLNESSIIDISHSDNSVGRNILHHYEHINYFVRITGCNDTYLSEPKYRVN